MGRWGPEQQAQELCVENIRRKNLVDLTSALVLTVVTPMWPEALEMACIKVIQAPAGAPPD